MIILLHKSMQRNRQVSNRDATCGKRPTPGSRIAKIINKYLAAGEVSRSIGHTKYGCVHGTTLHVCLAQQQKIMT